MNARIIIALVGLLAFFMSACAPDPRREADAYKTRVQADALAAAQAEQVWAQTNTDSIKNQHDQIAIQNEKAAQDQWQATTKQVIYWSGLALTIALVLSLTTTAIGFSWAVVGTGKALAHAAEVRSNMIHLDRVTRQFPLLLQYVSHGKFSLTNMNNGQTLLLDTRNEADRQMISAASMVQVAGVIASEARKSSDPAAIAIMQPPAIDAKDNDLKVGLDLFQALNAWEAGRNE